jgi:ankyrin repeat protein
MDLLEAVGDGDLDRVNQLLLNPQVNVNVTDHQGSTPLIIAGMHCDVEIGQRLIHAGANINQANNDGMTPLMWAVIRSMSVSSMPFITLLLDQPHINVNAATVSNHVAGSYERTSLVIAVSIVVSNKSTNFDLVKLLLEHGADPNIPRDFTTVQQIIPRDFNTPLNIAVRYQNPDLIKLLLVYGADINQKGFMGYTPLMSSVSGKHRDNLMYLLTVRDIDIDASDDHNRTALTIAASSQNGFPYVKALIKAGADPFLNAKNQITDSLTKHTPITSLLREAQINWLAKEKQAFQDLSKKFMIARRLRMGIQTTDGHTLELAERQLSESIIRKAEYSNLCNTLQSNLMKPGVIALAKSLYLPTSDLTKRELCQAIANKITM